MRGAVAETGTYTKKAEYRDNREYREGGKLDPGAFCAW